jgi:hypothetical protein
VVLLMIVLTPAHWCVWCSARKSSQRKIYPSADKVHLILPGKCINEQQSQILNAFAVWNLLACKIDCKCVDRHRGRAVYDHCLCLSWIKTKAVFNRDSPSRSSSSLYNPILSRYHHLDRAEHHPHINGTGNGTNGTQCNIIDK